METKQAQVFLFGNIQAAIYAELTEMYENNPPPHEEFASYLYRQSRRLALAAVAEVLSDPDLMLDALDVQTA